MKNMKVVMVVMFMALFVASSAMAAVVYTTATVNRTATTANGSTQLKLTDTGSNWAGGQWFTCPTGSDDQALATALTAMSLGKNVRIGFDDTAPTVLTQIGLQL